ncbi:gamma-glutamyl-gamma-aminobutyrate hydrolase [Salipaludibacillus neizhouensis]|uniref:Gamma-glutamyl-gamma-aminobutyrate hydrolase n=1 Tax=Salipaludibacillus neizhouensis TaxID=885475 RepID=A0A3A9KBA5_9BACI|nr:gamma-glutamyl-gamma-aminobutyrate hydrolase family protein [Salipaludibacillus neizhouensis]RKL66853.1 gamma-glutamyl-gamma-aminobutyrate hydrolase [Salipaludibacillus neizhouensis]
MKPLIGITSSTEVDEVQLLVGSDNINAVSRAGGLPVILPNLADEIDILEFAEKIDGLVLTGGYDIDPTLFGEEPYPNLGTIIPARDIFEITLIKELLEMNKPILAVCRGCQILNIAAGGDMYQDMYTQINRDLLQHAQNAPKGHGSHYVTVVKDSLLNRLTGVERLKVNSRHHQANRRVLDPFTVSGIASDGIIESIESKEHSFVLGLQWHPENMAKVDDFASVKIFEGFIAACQI